MGATAIRHSGPCRLAAAARELSPRTPSPPTNVLLTHVAPTDDLRIHLTSTARPITHAARAHDPRTDVLRSYVARLHYPRTRATSAARPSNARRASSRPQDRRSANPRCVASRPANSGPAVARLANPRRASSRPANQRPVHQQPASRRPPNPRRANSRPATQTPQPRAHKPLKTGRNMRDRRRNLPISKGRLETCPLLVRIKTREGLRAANYRAIPRLAATRSRAHIDLASEISPITASRTASRSGIRFTSSSSSSSSAWAVSTRSVARNR